MTRTGLMLAACTLILVAGCNLEPIADIPSASVLEAGTVRVTLEVNPDTIDRPGVAVATLKYENTTDRTIVLTSVYGCLAFVSVYHDTRRVSFPSTDYRCTAAVSHFDLEPGEPKIVNWPLPIGGAEGVDIPAGTYRFVAHLNTHADSLERVFIVR